MTGWDIVVVLWGEKKEKEKEVLTELRVDSYGR